MGVRLEIAALLLALGGCLAWSFWPVDAERLVSLPTEHAQVAAHAESLALTAPELAAERIAQGNAAPNAAADDHVPRGPTGSGLGLWVLVVDERQQPLEGVPVLLRRESNIRTAPDSFGTSAADGRLWLTAQLDVGPTVRRVEPAGPGLGSFGVDVDLTQLDGEPVLLVLGDGAGLDVEVIDDGGASTEGAVVRVISLVDYDAAYGSLHEVDPAYMLEGRVRAGVCSFGRLPAGTDLFVHVVAPSPLGTLGVRARSLAAGERTRVEARYSAEDLVLLGEFRGDFADAHWTWSLFHPEPLGFDATVRRNLIVADDGRFVVRLPAATWRRLKSAVCLVVNHGLGSFLELVELPPIVGPGVVRLPPIDAASSVLCAGRVLLGSTAGATPIRFYLAGNRPPGEPMYFEQVYADPDGEGRFSLRGRVPAHWTWQLRAGAADWRLREPVVFQPGSMDLRLEFLRRERPATGRLVPGPDLAASAGWGDHLFVQLHTSDGSEGDIYYPERDGTLAIAAWPEGVGMVTVGTAWHNRPIVELYPVAGEPVHVELPTGLRLARLDVRGGDGEPREARAVDTGGIGAIHGARGAESPLVVLLDLPSQDVLVRADGYRDTVISGVSGNRRVHLTERGIPVVLRVLDLPELGEDVRIRPLLARVPNVRSSVGAAVPLDSNGQTTLLAGDVGEFYVHLLLERVVETTVFVRRLDGPDNPRIRVSEPLAGQSPEEFTLVFDSARLLELTGRMR